MSILVEFPASTLINSSTILSPLPPPLPKLQPPRSRSPSDFFHDSISYCQGPFHFLSSSPTSNHPLSISSLSILLSPPSFRSLSRSQPYLCRSTLVLISDLR
ncbi:hypothetical protein DFH28DRAFT_1128431 [Melampsora americana]|nr:hypothetical protein DFH28DRAFT_1128431 [Melampsora americana]